MKEGLQYTLFGIIVIFWILVARMSQSQIDMYIIIHNKTTLYSTKYIFTSGGCKLIYFCIILTLLVPYYIDPQTLHIILIIQDVKKLCSYSTITIRYRPYRFTKQLNTVTNRLILQRQFFYINISANINTKYGRPISVCINGNPTKSRQNIIVLLQYSVYCIQYCTGKQRTSLLQ